QRHGDRRERRGAHGGRGRDGAQRRDSRRARGRGYRGGVQRAARARLDQRKRPCRALQHRQRTLICASMGTRQRIPHRGAASRMKPPVAKKIAHTTSLHDHTRVDEFFWLRNREDPDVVAYLEAENAYAAAILERSTPERDDIYHEMVARIQETDSSVPVARGEYRYYVRTEKGSQYELFCRRHGDDAPEEILIDENEMAAGHSYFHVGVREVSPDHRLLAYTVDLSGGETYRLFVMDIATRRIIDGPIEGVAGDLEWENDSGSFYYLDLDEQMRPWRVRRHVLGGTVAGDEEVYAEDDPAFYVGIEIARSREFLFVTMESHTTTEVRFRRAGDITSALRIVHERRADVEYHLV